MRTLADLTFRLQELHLRTAETPLFNPVFQLGIDLSRDIENGDLSLDAIEALVGELEDTGLASRAKRLQRLVDPRGSSDRLAQVIARHDDFAAFKARWEKPAMHAVFTAHPTFLLTDSQTRAVAAAAVSAREVDDFAWKTDPERRPITLEYEHDRVMDAIRHAASARDRMVAAALDRAKADWPDDWLALQPLPIRFASWVGYDMDGRTDIAWYTSIAFRLKEKHDRLLRYADSLKAIDEGHNWFNRLKNAAAETARHLDAFSGDLTDPDILSKAANDLTADRADKLTSLAGCIADLEAEAKADAGNAVALKTLAAAMRADGLGAGWIHFRVNAKQLHNAIRRRMPGEPDLTSRSALAALNELIAKVRPLDSNFGALAIEGSTAIRQFLAMRQILDHIDSDAPIRMLIAESEQPTTVLAALYFAKLFGIDDKVDVSPLFETETALEHGGRLLDELCAEPEYRSYVKQRGRLCIQTGFSDAGRFVGQIPASLAIERLQGRLAEAMAANGLAGVSALIFNTHGESMGRGAHPSDFTDRLTWPLSPWARRRFAKAGIALEPEASFQGGDGYIYFANDELALGTLVAIAECPPDETAHTHAPDPFYQRTDLSLDFYRGIRDQQNHFLESRAYTRAITAFGLGMLMPTGSRVSRRQGDTERDMQLRQIRAIPHNAILQQLGYPVNVIAGLGTAAQGQEEDLAALLQDSHRGRQLVRLARAGNALASIKTVAAYGELFNAAYWASRPYRGMEGHLTDACESLASYLAEDERAGIFRRLAARLRVDALRYHRLIDRMPDEEPVPNREHRRRIIGAAQAIRLALMQHMFLRAVGIPAFSRANDISRFDVLEMVFSLRIDEALAQLRRAFPTSFPRIDDFALDAPTQYPDGDGEGYAAIQRDYIDRIERAHELSLRLGTTIANQFGAHG